MNSEKIKFGKMLKLIVAHGFPRSTDWSFTAITVLPILAFILAIFQNLTRDLKLPGDVVVGSCVGVFIISHFILRKYANKWALENGRALKKHEKKIIRHCWMYFIVYWGITILIHFCLSI
jgi:hypothetical protein